MYTMLANARRLIFHEKNTYIKCKNLVEYILTDWSVKVKLRSEEFVPQRFFFLGRLDLFSPDVTFIYTIT